MEGREGEREKERGMRREGQQGGEIGRDIRKREGERGRERGIRREGRCGEGGDWKGQKERKGKGERMREEEREEGREREGKSGKVRVRGLMNV